MASALPLLASFALFCLLAAPALAAELPALSGRVVDNAGLIDPETEAALTARLEAFERKSSDQIVVATVPSLDGEAIEPFSNRLFRFWRLGREGEDNGVLVLVARDDREVRIEVGYGLEGTLTDLHSKLIIENTLLPAFRAGDFSAGISGAVDDVITVLEGNAAELEARAERAGEAPETSRPLTPEELFVIAVVAFILLSFVGSLLVQLFGQPLGKDRYRWLGMEWDLSGNSSGGTTTGGWTSGSGGWSGGGGGWSGGSSRGGSSSGGFSGGGGSSGGGGASGRW